MLTRTLKVAGSSVCGLPALLSLLQRILIAPAVQLQLAERETVPCDACIDRRFIGVEHGQIESERDRGETSGKRLICTAEEAASASDMGAGFGWIYTNP